MIRHIVLFNLKTRPRSGGPRLVVRPDPRPGKIASARRLAINKLLDPREGWYKERISAEYGWALTMEFDDEDGLYAYQKDPQHVTVAAEIRKRVTNVKVWIL